MERIFVSYPTFTRLFGIVPTLFVPQGNGGYSIHAVGSDFLISCDTTGLEAGDFEANYKSISQQAASSDDALVLGYADRIKSPNVVRQGDGAQRVVVVGREGDETNWATHKFTDPTTWYGSSLRIEDEELSDSGDGLTWESEHIRWIDMTHGKVWDEEALRQDVEHGYSVIVQVDGQMKTERRPFATSGGDYIVDYLAGKVTFLASQAGKIVTAGYSYATDSTWSLKPYEGYLLDIEQSEIQVSQDLVMTGAVILAYYGLADHFAPGQFPPGTIIELGRTRYDRFHQITDEALGSYPVIGAPIGGAARGIQSPICGFPFHYGAVRRLWSKWKMEIRAWVEDSTGDRAVPFGGEYATATFYCVSREKAGG